ncbi:NAD(P)-dependent oxidoreductase [Novosphingobium gossypii]|uniref:NAD(P)-dependent oxidoreductase n=1 Tax=Novosphingobium gossypii TaxID=1604774 RepID=UPI003D1C8D94
MKIAVIGASGNVGSQIVREAAARGHDVLAVARHPERIATGDGITVSAGDASKVDEIAALITGKDAVISALHFDTTDTLLAAVRKAGVPRMLVTGGAASLEVAPGTKLIDTPAFPDEWKPFAVGGVAFLETLRTVDDVDWTFFSPAALIFDGPRTGHYRTGGDQLVTDDAGESKISFADYAIAMVDELEAHKHSKSRFTAAY